MISGEMLTTITMSGVVGAVIGVLTLGFPYLKKKGVDTEKVLDNTDKILESVEPAIDVVKSFIPGGTILDTIAKEAIKAVKAAQQLNNSSQLSNVARKQAATDSVYLALQEIGITPSDNQKKIINDAIEAAVYDLPHKPVDVKQLQSTIDQQNIQNQQLLQENTQLKNTISTITAAASAVQTTV